MPENTFSWFTVETDEQGNYHLFNNNQKGIHRLLVKSRNLEYIDSALSRREASKARIGELIANAMQKLMNDPEALKRLQETRPHD